METIMGATASKLVLERFDYMLVRNCTTNQYAYFKRHLGIWEQCTRWYSHYGNLVRFNPEIAKQPKYLLKLFSN